MTKTEYVERLHSMIFNRAEPCQCCPGAPGYDADKNSYFHAPFGSDENCRLCQDFVDFKFIRPFRSILECQYRKACPCRRIGANRAIERARKYLKQYENGTHKWQRKES